MHDSQYRQIRPNTEPGLRATTSQLGAGTEGAVA